MVRFRLLGDVEVLVDGRPVDVGHARQRCVLVALLVDAGRPVPIDTLAERVWGDRPPQRRREVLHSYLSRLRGALAGSPAVLERRSGGYVADVDPESVDLHRFRRLVAQSRAAATDDECALALVEQAVGLWGGEAFGTLDTAWLGEVRAALDKERFAAELDRNELALRLGRHAELVAELSAAALEHPLDERLAGQLVRALHLCGRTADALNAYQRIRQRLAGELGIDPGPALRDIELSVLRSRPTAGNQPIPGSRSIPGSQPTGDKPVPRQLPADVATFTGRDAELARLVGTDAAVSVIDGMAGVGKTALAVHAAHRLAGRFEHGQLFVDLHGFTGEVAPLDPADALDRLLRAVGVPGERIPPTVDERAALWRTRLADRRVLIVLDNAATEAQVRPLLPGGAGCRVLITSRRRLTGLDDADAVSVDVLAPDDAVRLFTDTAGPRRLDGEPADVVDEIVELCGRLPLALRIVAARLRARPAWPAARLLGRLRDERHRLGELRSGQRSVTAAFAISCEQLTPDQRRLFLLLGLHPGADFDRYAAAALVHRDAAGAELLAEDLVDAHLLQSHHPGRYRFHDLVRAYSAQTVAATTTEAEREAATDRLLGHYVGAAAAAVDRLYPWEGAHRQPLDTDAGTTGPRFADQAQASDWLDAELANLLAVAGYGRHAVTVRLSGVLSGHLQVRGRYTDATALHGNAVRSARHLRDAGGEVHALNSLGFVDYFGHRYDRAAGSFRRAAVIARVIGDQHGEARARSGLGFLHAATRRYSPAHEQLRQALTTARDIDDRAGTASALRGLGYVYWWTERFDRAVDSYEEALRIARSIGDRRGELRALAFLGDGQQVNGSHARAAEHYRRALTIARRLGDRSGELGVLAGLGRIRLAAGRIDAATEDFRSALSVARDLGDRTQEVQALCSLGEVDWLGGRHEHAVRNYELALGLACRIGKRLGELRARCGLGYAHGRAGRPGAAADELRRALEIADEIGDGYGGLHARWCVGDLHRRAGRLDEAAEQHGGSITAARAIGRHVDGFACFGEPAPATPDALGGRHTALQLAEARARHGLAEVHREQGDPDRAEDQLRRALELLAELGAAEPERIVAGWTA